MIDFSVPPTDVALRDKVRSFVQDTVIPFEQDERLTSHGPTDGLRMELNALARAAGLLAPHVAPEYGGMGLGHVQRALVFEAAGYSTLDPIALHCAAPDEGNMHMLELIASDRHEEEFLRPLATAQVRSCFAMTEPHPGAGSDPGQLLTRADREGDHYIVNGEKWLITGADGAGFMIVMARAFDGGQDIACEYAGKRRAFGSTLVRHEGVGFQLADNEIDLHMCRLAIMDVNWRLDKGEHARHESSIVKVFVSEALFRVADRCLQVLGGLGLTHDTQVERIFREIRAFRVYDGPSEVHRWAIASRIARSLEQHR